MFQANGSWFFPQHSSWEKPTLSCMNTSSESRQPDCLPACINPTTHMFSVSMSMPGSLVPGVSHGIPLPVNMAMPGFLDISTLKTEGKYHSRENEFLHQLCPSTSLPSAGEYLSEQQFMISNEQNGRATTNVAAAGSSQKRIVIFDQAEGWTRLIYGSLHPPSQHATTAVTEVASCLDLHGGRAVNTSSFTPTPPTLQEECDENHLSAEGSEMNEEDTEELNALLYSDGDDDDDYEDDEVMSSRHTPIAIKRKRPDQYQVDDIIEEVASSGGPNKRIKQLNGRLKQSLMVDATSHEFDSDTVSSHAVGQNEREETDSVLHNKKSKDRIRSTLKILESIIPGAKGKNPLLVLDESINYLRSLKLEAETLGVESHY